MRNRVLICLQKEFVQASITLCWQSLKLDILNAIIIVNRYVKVIDFMQRIKFNLCQTFPLW